MQNVTPQDHTIDSNSPLESLSAYLGDDMAHVNKAILDNMQADIDLIPQIAGYLIASGGKRLRPLLTLAATRLYDTDTERSFGLAAAVEFIHTATLLHDDVVDESDERRGKKTANLVFGNQASVLVGDFLFSRAFQLMVADGSLDVLRILSDASAIISAGEVKQLAFTGNLSSTVDDYIDIAQSKTAALFAAACEIGPVIADKDDTQITALREYGNNLGIAFQIVDDVLDYSAAQEKLGKTVGDDFAEAKMSLPVILALENATADQRAFWERTMASKDQKDGDLKAAQDILRETEALKRGMDMAKSYGKLAIEALAPVPQSALKTMLLDIIDFTISREF